MCSQLVKCLLQIQSPSGQLLKLHSTAFRAPTGWLLWLAQREL